MRSFLLDLMYSLRVFRRSPGVTFLAVLSLALGIGATSTIFSLVDGMYLRPLPVNDPEGLLWITSRSMDGRSSELAWPAFNEIRKSTTFFADIAAQSRRGAQLNGGAQPETVLLTVVSDNYFTLLGIRAAVGRLFRETLDSAMTNEPAIAISDSLWRRRFGADPALVGGSLRMNGRSFTVVGVLPPGFRGLDRSVRNDVWVPVTTWAAMGNRRELEEWGAGSFEAIGRLRAGRTVEQARAQLEAIGRRFEEKHPDTHRGRRLVAQTQEEMENAAGAQPGALLLSVVGLTVLIACANVAMLLLAQAEGRSREISIRLAVGAGRRRLARQMLAESILLAVTGATLALLVVAWLIPLFPALLPPRPDFGRFDIRLDLRVVAVTLFTCAVTVLFFGLAPAIKIARTDPMGVLRGRSSPGVKRVAGRNLLVVSQTALCVVLLTAAGLLARSFLQSRGQRLGFDADRNSLVLLTVVPVPRPQAGKVCDEITGRLSALPGVKSAAYSRRMPLGSPGGGATRDVAIPGRLAAPGEDLLRIRYNQVSVGYSSTTGTRLLSGRWFTAADSATSERVALVNQTMARRYWQRGSPIDRRIIVDREVTRVVGVVEDGFINRIHEDPEPFLLFPFAQAPVNEVTFIVETSGPPGPLLDTVRREIRSAQPGAVVLLSTTLSRHIEEALHGDWLPAVLSAAIGLLGMILTAAGLYGVVLHGVNSRFGEMGVRMALGAETRSVFAMILRQGLFLAVAGAAVGVFVSLASGRMIASLLYGVSPYDPALIVLSVFVVLAMSLAASAYPAWRATCVDPASVLRVE